MPKFKGLIVTIILSFFALFLHESNGNAFALNKVKQAHHDIKIERSLNTFAIAIDNSFQESIGFDNKKEQTTNFDFFAKHPTKSIELKHGLQYLKACDVFNSNFTTRKIIYPFHSFL